MNATYQPRQPLAVSRRFVVHAAGGAPVRLSFWRSVGGQEGRPEDAEILLSRSYRGRRHPLARLQAREPLAWDLARVLLEPGRSSHVVHSAVVALAHLLAETEAG